MLFQFRGGKVAELEGCIAFQCRHRKKRKEQKRHEGQKLDEVIDKEFHRRRAVIRRESYQQRHSEVYQHQSYQQRDSCDF